MIQGKTIVLLATVPWSDAWQRQQEWARQFGARNRVLYVEPMGMVNHGPVWLARKIFGILRRTRVPMYQHTLPADVERSIEQIKLVFIPWHTVGWINRTNARWLERQLRRLLVRRGEPVAEQDLILWVCNPTDTVVALAERFPTATLVYDIAMRFAKRTDAPTYIAHSQEQLARAADLIVYDNDASMRDLPVEAASKAHFIPQGLRQDFYAAAAEHPVLAGIPHPRIGFTGAGHDAFDATLVRAVIDKLPQVHVVLAGLYRKRDPILKHPRVHYVGALPIDQLPRLLAGMDVGIIPYKINDYTIGVFPTKFFEYLASGLPVVSTALPELARYREHVRIATRDGFADAVAAALARGKHQPDREFLDQHSWSRRFAEVEQLLASQHHPA